MRISTKCRCNAPPKRVRRKPQAQTGNTAVVAGTSATVQAGNGSIPVVRGGGRLRIVFNHRGFSCHCTFSFRVMARLGSAWRIFDPLLLRQFAVRRVLIDLRERLIMRQIGMGLAILSRQSVELPR